MFFYDNLSSLRATKKPLEEELEQLKKAPGSKIWPVKDRQPKTELDPSSKEFIPKSLRATKSTYRNSQDGSPWPESRKASGISPPPGLSRSKKIANIWGVDGASGLGEPKDSRWDSFRDDTFNSNLNSKLRNRAFPSDRYSVLMPQPDSEKPRHSEVSTDVCTDVCYFVCLV